MFFSLSYNRSIRDFMFWVVILPVPSARGMQFKFLASKCERMDFSKPFEIVCDCFNGEWQTEIIDYLAREFSVPPHYTLWKFTPRNIDECKSAYDAVCRHHSGVCVEFFLHCDKYIDLIWIISHRYLE